MKSIGVDSGKMHTAVLEVKEDRNVNPSVSGNTEKNLACTNPSHRPTWCHSNISGSVWTPIIQKV